MQTALRVIKLQAEQAAQQVQARFPTLYARNATYASKVQSTPAGRVLDLEFLLALRVW